MYYIINEDINNIVYLFYLYFADIDADPALVERNIKKLQVEQRKTTKHQDVAVLKQLLSATFEARLQQLLQLLDGKNRVSKALQDWPIIGQEIYVSNVYYMSGSVVSAYTITRRSLVNV